MPKTPLPPKSLVDLEKGLQRFVYDTMVAAQSLAMFREEPAGSKSYPRRCCEKIAGLIMARNLLQFLREKRTPESHRRHPNDLYAADFGFPKWTGSGLSSHERDWCKRINVIAAHVVDSQPPSFDGPEFQQVIEHAIRAAREFLKDCLAAGNVTVSSQTAKFRGYLDKL